MQAEAAHNLEMLRKATGNPPPSPHYSHTCLCAVCVCQGGNGGWGRDTYIGENQEEQEERLSVMHRFNG